MKSFVIHQAIICPVPSPEPPHGFERRLRILLGLHCAQGVCLVEAEAIAATGTRDTFIKLTVDSIPSVIKINHDMKPSICQVIAFVAGLGLDRSR